MEKKYCAFDALLQRKQILLQKKQELMSLRRHQSNERPSPEKSEDVIENSDTETPIKQPKVYHKTPIKCPNEQPESHTKRLGIVVTHRETPSKLVMEKAETPTKRLRTRSATPEKRQTNPPETPIKRFKTSSATIIKHSTAQQLDSHPGTPIKYLRDPKTTPLKLQMNQQSPNIDDTVIYTSTVNAKKYILPFLETRAGLKTVNIVPSSYNATVPDVYKKGLPETGFDAAALVKIGPGNSTAAPAIISQEIYVPFTDTGPGLAIEAVGELTTSSDTRTVPDVYYKTLLETGFDAAAVVETSTGNSTAAPAIISQEICASFADTGPGLAIEAVDVVTTSSDTRSVPYVYYKTLPKTGFDAAAVVETSPGNSTAAPAIISQEIFASFADTGPGLAIEAVDVVTTTSDIRTVPYVYYKILPETGFDAAAVVETSPGNSTAAPAIISQEICASFADTGPGLAIEAVDVVTTSSDTRTVPDVYYKTLPETGFDAAAVVETSPGNSTAAPAIISQDIYVPFADTGPGFAIEAVDVVKTSSDTRTVPDVYYKTLPETGFDAVAVVETRPGNSIAATATISQEIYVPFADTESELTNEAVDVVKTSSDNHTVPDVYNKALLETGFDAAGPGNLIAPVIISQEISVPFSETAHGSKVEAEDEVPTEKTFFKLASTPLQSHDTTSTSSNSDLTRTQKRRKRRQAVKHFRKSCMDFQSEEEKEDFSAGSSDLWTGSESNCESSDECDDKQKKKKKKKQLKIIKGNDQSIKIDKKKKRENLKKMNKKQRDDGKQYLTRKGKTIEEKSMKINPCVPGKCKRGCYEISDERRTSIFSFFWKLDVRRRRDWLVRCARAGPIRRKRTDSIKRNITYDYFINDGEDHRKVCQKFLLDTLDITQRFLLYTLSNQKEGMSQEEKRTRSAPDKYSESAKVNVHTFIEKLPACPSHYNRKKSKRMYLQQELKNLSNLFRIYLEDCKLNNHEAVSETIFRQIFNTDYDIGFHTPKKDKCTLCTKAETFGNEMSENDKEKLKKHLEEKEAMYRRFKAHQTLKDVDTLTCSFDLQKVLNTPFGESMLLYYSRKYAVFNFTVYESLTKNVSCFTWGECDGKRGGIEIASCLYLYLRELDKKGFKNALLYCDSCTGQNKNKVVLSVLNYFLHSSNNLQVIQINYLLPGHTYMPADSVHATIEAEVKKLIVWSPSQWPSYFESARKRPRPYSVTCMEHTDFIDWEELATKTFTKDTVKNIKFKDIRVAMFKKKKLNQIEIKYSMKEEALSEKVKLFQKVQKKIKGKGKGKGKNKEELDESHEIEYQQVLNSFNLVPKYSKKLSISASKYKDLKKLCSDGTIPKRFHREFQEMPYDGKISEALVQTDEEDEVSSEVEEEIV